MPQEHQITAIEPGSKRGRLLISVNGEQVLDLTKATVDKLGLRLGLSLLPGAQEEIRHDAALQEARVAAVKALGQRARTRAGLQQRLLRRGLPEREVAQALDWLAERGYLDDEQYAHDRWQALAQRRLGAQAIMRKLVHEGVPRALAEGVRAAQDSTLHETEQVLELARQRSAALSAVPWPKRRQRLYGFLARRGFDSEAIAAALTRLEQQEGSSGDAPSPAADPWLDD